MEPEKDIVEKEPIKNLKDKVKTYKEYANLLSLALEEQRKVWDSRIGEIYPKIKDSPEKMFEMQALALSYRHMLSDQIAVYMTDYFYENSSLKVKKRDRYVYYSTGVLPDGTKPSASEIRKYTTSIVGMRTSKAEKDVVIDGDLADHERILELLDNHVVFLREGIKTIDHALYGIKNKLEIMRLLVK